jgi:hypothetical protein
VKAAQDAAFSLFVLGSPHAVGNTEETRSALNAAAYVATGLKRGALTMENLEEIPQTTVRGPKFGQEQFEP